MNRVVLFMNSTDSTNVLSLLAGFAGVIKDDIRVVSHSPVLSCVLTIFNAGFYKLCQRWFIPKQHEYLLNYFLVFKITDCVVQKIECNIRPAIKWRDDNDRGEGEEF